MRIDTIPMSSRIEAGIFRSWIILLNLIIYVTVTCSSNSSEICSLTKWKLYKQKYGKNYEFNSTEDLKRRAIFCKNLRKVIEHNAEADSKSYRITLNHLSDRNEQELSRIMGHNRKLTGQLPSKQMQILGINELSKFIDLDGEPPAHMDWSKDPQRVSPARQQGDCGSCWAFTTVALLEGQEKPANDEKLVYLSEQNLVDCDKINDGCEGGDIPEALQEIKRFGGLMKRQDYPYVSGRTGLNETCKMNPEKAFKTTINLGTTRMLEPGNEFLLKQIVASYGPVAVSIVTNELFASYESGVFYDPTCYGEVTHAVTLVGYGTHRGQDYWKIKNSWSKYWGLNGFGLIARNRQNNCNISSDAYIITPD